MVEIGEERSIVAAVQSLLVPAAWTQEDTDDAMKSTAKVGGASCILGGLEG